MILLNFLSNLKAEKETLTMALDYSIYDSNGNYYDVGIPVANYYKDEGLLLSATVFNHWRGYNNELFSLEREEDKIILFDVDEEIIYELSLEEFKQWLNTLNEIYSHLEMLGPIMDILEGLKVSDKERVSVSFG